MHESPITDSNGFHPLKKVTFLSNALKVLIEWRRFTYKMEEDMVRSREVSISEEGRENFGGGF